MSFNLPTPSVKPLTGMRAASAQPFPSAPPASSPRGALDPIFDTFEKPFNMLNTNVGNLPFREKQEDTMARTLHMPSTPLITGFFSARNLQRVQKLLHDAVAKRTGFQIGPQSGDQLLVVMRAMYADHSVHNPPDLKKEITRLNRIVVGAVLDKVIANMTSHLAYLRDASRPREPIPLGVATSTKGTKTYELFRRV